MKDIMYREQEQVPVRSRLMIKTCMSMQASSDDLAELVGRDRRRFDLLAVGLQEVPRRNVARLLQAALDETHRYKKKN